MVEDPTSQHVLAEDGDGGRDGLAGVVVEASYYHHRCLQEICVDNKGLRPSGLVKHIQLLGEQAELRARARTLFRKGEYVKYDTAPMRRHS